MFTLSRTQSCRLFLCLIAISQLTGCGWLWRGHRQDGPPAKHVDLRHIKDAKPVPLPKSRYGNPRSYVALGKRYWVLPSAKGYDKTGIASWYGTKFHGQLTSTREPYDMYAMTAASTELPLPTFVRVTNLSNQRTVIVKVNDRGPFAHQRILDLSYAAAQKLGILKKGTGLVRVTAIDPRTYHSQAAPYESAPSTPSTAHTPQIYLQLGVYTARQGAKQLQTQLTMQAIHWPTQIQTVSHHAQTQYRLILGPLPDVDTSDQLIARFAKLGLEANVHIIDNINPS